MRTYVNLDFKNVLDHCFYNSLVLVVRTICQEGASHPLFNLQFNLDLNEHLRNYPSIDSKIVLRHWFANELIRHSVSPIANKIYIGSRLILTPLNRNCLEFRAEFNLISKFFNLCLHLWLL
jgi:hypothetical protein